MAAVEQAETLEPAEMLAQARMPERPALMLALVTTADPEPAAKAGTTAQARTR
jgi:hypothetical protein